MITRAHVTSQEFRIRSYLLEPFSNFAKLSLVVVTALKALVCHNFTLTGENLLFKVDYQSWSWCLVTTLVINHWVLLQKTATHDLRRVQLQRAKYSF